jgi:hypothetical protein
MGRDYRGNFIVQTGNVLLHDSLKLGPGNIPDVYKRHQGQGDGDKEYQSYAYNGENKCERRVFGMN